MKKLFFVLCSSAIFFSGPVWAGKVALLWIPANNSSWANTLQEVGKTGFRVTVSLAPEMLTENAGGLISSLNDAGQAESALRIYGDPLLALLFAPASPEVKWEGKDSDLWSTRLDEMASRIFDARSMFDEKLKLEPAGFVPEAGGTVPEMISLAKAGSMRWIASGEPAGANGAVLDSDETLVVPFKQVRNLDEFRALLGGVSGDDVVFAVIDETLPWTEPDNPRKFITDLAGLFSESDIQWLTVSQALDGQTRVQPLDLADYPAPWSGDYSPWAGKQRQQNALRNIDAAIKSLGISQNSVARQSGSDRKLMYDFYAAEGSAELLALGSSVPREAAAAEERFKKRLKAIYRKILRPIPPMLTKPFSQEAEDKGEPEKEDAGAAQFASIKSGQGWIMMENQKHENKVPEAAAVSTKTASPADSYRIDSVYVSWDDSTLTFEFRNPEFSPEMKKNVLLDLYVDMNHRARSGLTELLPERGLRASAEDAWEFAMSVSNGEVRLYRATPQKGEFQKAYPAAYKTGAISFSVPRSVIRGNPENWGYCALSMARASVNSEGDVLPGRNEGGGAVTDYAALDKLDNVLYFFRLAK